MCPFIGFSLDYAAKSQIFETKGKKFYFKRNPQKCGIPQNEISHQKKDISAHMNYVASWLYIRAISCCLIFYSTCQQGPILRLQTCQKGNQGGPERATVLKVLFFLK